ncbi:response regulator transcription factor [Staphylococcus chromogenes]|nr:response regulator transcription factor [Staphylococcus chromogenes]TRL27100.1 response regulator transcription factor [Staphylococcus chromogenes]
MTYKIFMIEDDAQLAHLIQSYLTKYNYEVVLCDNYKKY